MDLNQILSGSIKKGNGSVPEPLNNSESVEFSQPIDNTIAKPVKSGYSSSVSVSNPTYGYESGSSSVSFACERLDNQSEANTGTLSIVCWISEKERSNNEWQSDNYACLGEYELGFLEVGYGFPDVDCTFEITENYAKILAEMNECGAEVHFIFTVNELHEDGNNYIIYTINGPNENFGGNWDVEETIKAIIIEKLGVEESEITYDASIVDDLNADSLDAVELIMEFEKAFGIEIPEDDAETITTVGEAIDYIKSRVN